MPEELKALMRKGQKVKDRLERLSNEAEKINAEACKLLVRPGQETPTGPGKQPQEEASAARVG